MAKIITSSGVGNNTGLGGSGGGGSASSTSSAEGSTAPFAPATRQVPGPPGPVGPPGPSIPPTPRLITTNGEIAAVGDYIIYDGSITIGVPSAVANPGAAILFAKTGGAGVLTLDPDGAEQIEGAATRSWSSVVARFGIISTGTQWHVHGTRHD